MSCGQDRDRLAVYLDGELTAEQVQSVEQHIRACPDCAAEIAAMVSLRRAMRPAATRFTPGADLRQKIQVRVAPRRSIRWIGPAAASAMAIMVLAVVWMLQDAHRNELFREVADLHVSDLASANPYDVVSSDRHTVKPWFQGKIPFSFNLPEFAGTDFTLLGGRMIYLDQRPTAQVVVGMGQHKISVVITQETPALGSALPFSSGAAVRDSFNVDTWQQHGLRFFVIGDAEKPAIQQLSKLFENANQ